MMGKFYACVGLSLILAFGGCSKGQPAEDQAAQAVEDPAGQDTAKTELQELRNEIKREKEQLKLQRQRFLAEEKRKAVNREVQRPKILKPVVERDNTKDGIETWIGYKVNGQRDGVWVQVERHGAIVGTAVYRRGVYNGTYVMWEEVDGELQPTAFLEYKNAKLHGLTWFRQSLKGGIDIVSKDSFGRTENVTQGAPRPYDRNRFLSEADDQIMKAEQILHEAKF